MGSTAAFSVQCFVAGRAHVSRFAPVGVHRGRVRQYCFLSLEDTRNPCHPTSPLQVWQTHGEEESFLPKVPHDPTEKEHRDT